MSRLGRLTAIAPSYVWAMTAITIVWSTSLPLTKWALQEIPPLTFAWLRFSITALALLPFGWSRRGHGWTGADLRRAVVMGLVGFSLVQVVNTWSLELTEASHVVVLSAMTPILVAGLAALVLRELISHRGWLGLVVSLIGVGLIIAAAPSARKASAPDPLLGDLLAFGTYVGWSSYYIIGRDLTRRYPPIGVLTIASIAGAIGLAPFGIAERAFGPPVVWTLPGILVVLHTALLVNAVGFLGQAWSLSRAGAANVATFMYLQPLFGLLFSAWILGERPSLAVLAGGALILGGVTLVIAEERRQPAPAEPQPLRAP